MNSKQWHKHKDDIWHKVESGRKKQHELKLPEFCTNIKFGIEFTDIVRQASGKGFNE